jgi:hypothetical protein
MQLIVIEEMTRLAKAADGQLPLRALFTRKPVMTSAYLHALFTFAPIAVALWLRLPPELLDQAMRIRVGDWFASRVASSRGCAIIKRALTADLHSAMTQYCVRAVTPFVIEVFTMLCETDRFFKRMRGPAAIPVAEAVVFATALAAKYCGVSRRSFDLLEDPKQRIFAMFPGDVPVPREIDDFFAAQNERVARVHVVESTHEW